jgi:hypothetical protein
MAQNIIKMGWVPFGGITCEKMNHWILATIRVGAGG